MILGGVLTGFFATAYLEKQNVSVSNSTNSMVKIFINSFTINYWYFFLLWLFGLMSFGFVLSYFTIFIKGFMVGVLMGVLTKNGAIYGVGSFVRYAFGDIIILIPSFIYLSYQSVMFSFKKDLYGNDKGKYLRILLLTTLAIVFYSILKAATKLLIEV